MKKYWILFTAIILLIIGIVWHFSVNPVFSSGQYVLDYFSAGQFSCGVFSAGTFSIGIFSIGIFSAGIFSIGIFNIGLFSIGLFVIAWKKSLPNLFKQK